ncbi:hypothetical protein LINPERHAP1_LOCUS1380 [Linum perenne]
MLARDKKDSSKISKVGRVMTCTFCTKEGHNTRTCALRKAGGSSNDRGNSSTVDSNKGLKCTQENGLTSNIPT